MSKDNYTFPVNQLITLGDPRDRKETVDFAGLGITSEHIPALIQLLGDEDLALADSDSPEVWASLYAWRALGELKAVEAIDALVAKMVWSEEVDDDWAPDELPGVFAKIGPVTIPALTSLLQRTDVSPYVCAHTGEALIAIAEAHSDTRNQCIGILTQQIQFLLDKKSADFDEEDELRVTFMVGNLIDLNALESLSVIEAAYKADRIDPSVHGDWEDVQIELGLLAKRETPAPHYVFLQEERRKTKKATIAQKEMFKSQQQRQTAQKAQKKNKRKMEAKSKKKNRKKK